MGLTAVAVLAALLLGTSDPLPPGAGEPDPRGPRRVTVHVVPTPAVVQPGETFSVHAEVTPAPGIKVYAPGNRAYAPVTWTMKWPDTVRATQPGYPPSSGLLPWFHLFAKASAASFSTQGLGLGAGTQNLRHSTPHGPFYKTLSL